METKAPNPARLHPMGTPHAPQRGYVAPCGDVLPNAVVAWAHWLFCIICDNIFLQPCDDCGLVGGHDPDVEH